MEKLCWKKEISESKVEAGLVGFGPTTTGLRVRCATWLRHRPIKRENPRVVINLKIVKEIKI
ncbi:MAG: hypothetical protein HW410_1283 [Nitrosarchaeum sp.]|nr:hypothetical protein [Nitrosarchaeum sp.]